MRIVHLAAELAPLVKIGGLGDVLQGLSRALFVKGHEVEVIIPKYDVLNVDALQQLKLVTSSVKFSVWRGFIDLVAVILIESHDPEKLFSRETVYGCDDDPLRFTFFSDCALEYLRQDTAPIDVIHLHDWHTAVAAPLLKKKYKEKKIRVVFTIHNLFYQGYCKEDVLDRLGWKSEKIKEGDLYNLLKAGVIYSDYVTTVSPNYAKEILKTEPILKKYKRKFSGVLNGIDYGYWDPAKDLFLPFFFSLENLENKKKVKRELQKNLRLEEEDSPLVAAVTRLVPQKGPELIKAALLRTLELGGQFVLLGSSFDEKTHKHFYNLKRKLAGSRHVHLELSYNEKLSHIVYGASDLFLIPSLFEPCGLTQMIAMRYGSIPIVRETGGLVDTVFDGENGFSFGPPTAEAICVCLERAFSSWGTGQWNKLIESAMKQDYSWNHPAENYLRIYRGAFVRKKA